MATLEWEEEEEKWPSLPSLSLSRCLSFSLFLSLSTPPSLSLSQPPILSLPALSPEGARHRGHYPQALYLAMKEEGVASQQKEEEGKKQNLFVATFELIWWKDSKCIYIYTCICQDARKKTLLTIDRGMHR